MGRILKEDYVGSGQSFQGVKSLWALYWKVAEHTRILLEGHNKFKRIAKRDKAKCKTSNTEEKRALEKSFSLEAHF